jgi:16S rRNA (cytosine967-C5)-methyltransferase
MNRAKSYLNSAWKILQLYDGSEPFASFIKKFFSQNKKFGSTDRKHISQLCYSYFRLGKSALRFIGEERILLGLFLSSNSTSWILQELRPNWNTIILLPLSSKCSMPDIQFSSTEIFPWEKELSNGIDYDAFCSSFLSQPDLFIRIRPGKEKILKEKLDKAGLSYNALDTHCIALPNSTNIEKYADINKEFVVQDFSSQKVAGFLSMLQPPVRIRRVRKVWDCCAGSGGKSILAYDGLPNIYLTVSDVRNSILSNLHKRFAQADIRSYVSFVADLSSTSFREAKINAPVSKAIKNSKFDLIIADVPCTGSGTWGRTPEMLSFFQENSIGTFSSGQKEIVGNVVPFLQTGGCLLYITCSVFKKENEEIVRFLEKEHQLKTLRMKLLTGYEKKADTLFAALLQK